MHCLAKKLLPHFGLLEAASLALLKLLLIENGCHSLLLCSELPFPTVWLEKQLRVGLISMRRSSISCQPSS